MTPRLQRLMDLQYTPGKSLILADALSHSKPPKTKSNTEQDISIHVNLLQKLSTVDRVIIKSNRVVVPTSLRGRMLQIIYERHMGIAKCRSRTCQALYWHKMNEDIHKMVSNCDTFQLYQYKQRKEPFASA